jgi:GrpB-like predicted nucleotidyltransferase (UPF0157 family)
MIEVQRPSRIEIVPYDPSWPDVFEAEAGNIRRLFGAVALSIDHVGSTSVPGMAAKAIVDIQVSLRSLEPRPRYRKLLEQIGYTHVPLGAFDLVYPYFEKPVAWPHTHHVHLCVSGSEQERNHLAFRDYLRAHPQIARQYIELKRELAAECTGDTRESRERYSLSKTDFVTAVVARALLEGYPCGSAGRD